LISNVLSLYGLRLLNQVIGLLLLPIITRQYGASEFGYYAQAMAIVGYFVIVCDYGFDLSATKKIALSNNDSSVISNIVSKVFFSKIFLLFICFILLVASIVFINPIRVELYLTCFFLIASQVLFPSFAFQGLQQSKYILKITAVTKLTSSAVVILLAYKGADIYWYPMTMFIFNFIGLLGAFFILSKQYNVNVYSPNAGSLSSTLVDGFDYFLTKLGNGIIAMTPIVVISILYTPAAVAYYSIAEKIQRTLDGLFLPLIQALFPYFSKNIKNKSIFTFKNLALSSCVFVIILFISLTISLFSDLIITKIFGEEFKDAGGILSILVFVPPISYLRSILTEIVMINLGLQDKVKNRVWIAVAFSTGIYLLLGNNYGSVGVAYGVLISESFLILLSVISLIRYKSKLEQTPFIPK
jgi:PST family polysaccharide transporter